MRKAVKRNVLTYGVAGALALGGVSVLAQTAEFSGTVPVDATAEMSDSAEYEQYLALATVSLPDAITAAQDSLGSEALATEVELDEEGGFLVWEIDLGGQTVYVDAGSAEVLATEADDSDEDPAQAQVSLLDAVTAAQEAVGLETFPGSISLDDEGGALVWEASFGDQEVTVDAATGEVLSTETDD